MSSILIFNICPHNCAATTHIMSSMWDLISFIYSFSSTCAIYTLARTAFTIAQKIKCWKVWQNSFQNFSTEQSKQVQTIWSKVKLYLSFYFLSSVCLLVFCVVKVTNLQCHCWDPTQWHSDFYDEYKLNVIKLNAESLTTRIHSLLRKPFP